MQELSTFGQALRKLGGDWIHFMRPSQSSSSTYQIRNLSIIHIDHALQCIQNGFRDVVHIRGRSLKKMSNLNRNFLLNRRCVFRPRLQRSASHAHSPSGKSFSPSRLLRNGWAINIKFKRKHPASSGDKSQTTRIKTSTHFAAY